MMVVIFNISVHGEKCGSTPLLYQAVRTAKLKAQRMGNCAALRTRQPKGQRAEKRVHAGGVIRDGMQLRSRRAQDGQTRRVQYLPDGTLCKLWMQ